MPFMLLRPLLSYFFPFSFHTVIHLKSYTIHLFFRNFLLRDRTFVPPLHSFHPKK